MSEYLTPEEVDTLLKLPRGKAKRLAKRGLIPSLMLPGGIFRFPSNIGELIQQQHQKKAQVSA